MCIYIYIICIPTPVGGPLCNLHVSFSRKMIRSCWSCGWEDALCKPTCIKKIWPNLAEGLEQLRLFHI